MCQPIAPVILARDSRPRFTHHQPRGRGARALGDPEQHETQFPPSPGPAVSSESDARCPSGGSKGLRFPASDLAGEAPRNKEMEACQGGGWAYSASRNKGPLSSHNLSPARS